MKRRDNILFILGKEMNIFHIEDSVVRIWEDGALMCHLFALRLLLSSAEIITM
jgi:hypothetical protein